MPTETHTHLLLKGKQTWNNRRELCDFRPYFSFEDFAEEFRKEGNLDHNGRVPLSEFNLSGATFHGTNLNRVDFLGANLRGARFRGVSLFDTNFFQADLTDAKFALGNASQARFSNAILKCTDLERVNLTGADLGGSQFWQAKLFPQSQNEDKYSGSRVHKIESVADLIDTCFDIRDRHGGLVIYFRGERDSSWCLRSSVMRPSKDNTFKLRLHEGEMLRDLIARRPEDFHGMNSALEQMVMAQHHGLKTRLLDVSRNPCVALFSACDHRDPAGIPQPNDMDGRIHVFAVPKDLVRSFDSDTISIIANFAKLDRRYQSLLLGKTADEMIDEDAESPLQYVYSEGLRHLYHYIRQEKQQFEELIEPQDLLKVFIVEPKESFDRIRAQEGAFIISAFHERFEREQILSRVANTLVYGYETIVVPEGKKARMLEELSLLNFTRENLYPSLDEVANRITQPYQ